MLILLVVAAALLVLGRRSNLHHKHTIAEFEQQHRPAMQTNPVYSSTRAVYGVPFEPQHDHASSDQPIAVATQCTYDVVEQSCTYHVPVEPSFAEISQSAATRTLANATYVSSDGSVPQAVIPLYAVPLEGTDGGASTGIVHVDSLATSAYRTLDQKAAYSSPRPQNEWPYDALVTTAAVVGAAYSIPSEGGSVVVYGATAPESDQNEQYLEVGGTPEDDIPTSVPATVVQDVPFVPTADGIYKSGSVAREGFVVHGNMGHQHVLEGAAREDDTAA